MVVLKRIYSEGIEFIVNIRLFKMSVTTISVLEILPVYGFDKKS